MRGEGTSTPRVRCTQRDPLLSFSLMGVYFFFLLSVLFLYRILSLFFVHISVFSLLDGE